MSHHVMNPARIHHWRSVILLALLFATPLAYLEPRLFGISLPDAFNVPKHYLVSFTALALVLLSAFELITCRQLSIPWGTCAAALSLFITWSAASLSFGPSFHAGVREVARWMVCGIIFISSAAGASSPQRTKAVIMSAVSAAGIVAALALAQFFGLDFSSFSGGLHKIYATVGNPNFVASYLAVVLPAGYWGWCTARNGRKGPAAFLAFSIIGTAALLVTGSRAGVASLLGGALVSLVVFRSPCDGRRAIALVLIVAALVTFFYLPSPINRYDMGALRKIPELAGSPRAGTGWRVMVWRVSAEMLRQRPLFGWGAGSFPLLYLDYAIPFLGRPENARFAPLTEGGIDHVHNEYLEIGVEFGLVGGALFALFIASLLCGALRAAGRQEQDSWIFPAMYAACVSLLIDSAVSYPLRLWPTAATFFAFAGALAAANSTERTVRVEGAVPRIAIGAVVAICGWSCFSSMASTVMSELQSARGIEAFERGDTDTAMRDLERAVRRQPRNGRAHFFLGLCLAQQRLYDEAISEMRIALTTYRRQAIYLELGKAHEKTGNAVEAQRFLDAAVLMFPRDAEAWNTKGAFLSGRGDAAGAAACFRRALSLTPSSFDAARNLAVSCQAAGMDDEALRAYERAIALKPGLAADLYVNMGAILAVRGDTTGARLLWEKALSIDPGNTDAQENLRRLNSH